MSFIETIFFVYTFISLYMVCLFVLLYVQNRDKLFSYPKGKPEPVSIVMPCYNEADSIGKAIESLLSLNYPKNMLEIIIVDDKSTDNSAEIIKQYTRKYNNVRLIINKHNSGGAAEPTNIGVKAAKYPYIAVADADSTPDKDALIKMIGFLQKDPKVGAVTCSILVKNPSRFMEKLQAIEYALIGFTRKLLDAIDSVYVTPGPFALYRKKTLIQVGLFDTKNITQDIEVTWRLLSHGYVSRMCLATEVRTITPTTFKKWWKQRIRWNIGGTQTVLKYLPFIFRKGILGNFIIPFFTVSAILGITGLGIFTYLGIKRILSYYLSLKYSAIASTAILSMENINLHPSVLNFFGATLFILGTIFTILCVVLINEQHLLKNNKLTFLFYLTIYLALYPINLIVALFKLATGRYSW